MLLVVELDEADGLVSVEDVEGGGRAEPLVLDGAGFAGFVVVELVLVSVDEALGVVAEAFAPELAAELLEAMADWPAHQSFFARCDGEAFR